MASLDINLTSIGDSQIVNLNFIEQVTAVTDVAVISGGTSTTRVLISEFRWSTDGTFSGPWVALTAAQLSALVLDPDNRFYIQVQFRRDGSDASGAIQVHRVTFDYSFDDTADYGAGQIELGTITSDITAFVIALIQSEGCMINNADGNAAYDVVYPFYFDWVNCGHKPVIFLNQVDSTEWAPVNGCNFDQTITMRIGIQKVKDRTKDYLLMIDRVRNIFHPIHGGFLNHSFTFKGVVFNSVTLTSFSIHDTSATAVLDRQDPKYKIEWGEFAASLTIRFGSPVK